MTMPNAEDLGEQLRAIASWGDPGEVPELAELAARYPIRPVEEPSHASHRRWWAISAAAVLLLVAGGVWALAQRSENRTVTAPEVRLPEEYPWLLPAPASTLQPPLITIPANGSSSPTSTTVFFSSAEGLTSELFVGTRNPAIADVVIHDGRVSLANGDDPLPTSAASTVETDEFGTVAIVCVGAVQNTPGTAASGRNGPLMAVWTWNGYDVVLTADASESESLRTDCDASGHEAAQLATSVQGIREVTETEWRAAFEEQNLSIHEIPGR